MNEKINITKADGTNVAADIICFLENNTGKRYVYYTLNEMVGAGANSTVKIYVAKVAQNNPALDTPITDADWDKLKGYMSDALKGNANSEIKYLPISELGTPVSVSERAIAMPTSYDYINKQRGIYAQNVAVAEVAVTPEPTVTPAAAPTVEQPAPVSEPVVPETPVVEPTVEPAVQEPAPVVPEAPNVFDTPSAPEVAPEAAPAPEQPVVEETSTDESSNGGVATLTPINLEEIEAKYASMIESVNKLKEQELEAAKRYNATLELSAMHNEQHANYVQSEQSKEIGTTPIEQVATPTPSAPEVTPTAPVAPEATPAVPEAPAPTQEPQVVEPTPVVPETPVSDANLETNWFDMPNN